MHMTALSWFILAVWLVGSTWLVAWVYIVLRREHKGDE